MRTSPVCRPPLQISQMSEALEVLEDEVTNALENSGQEEADENLGAPKRGNYLG